MGSSYGHWSDCRYGMPQFVLTVQDNVLPEAKFNHLISTGRLGAIVDRYAKIRPFTTDGIDGMKWFCGENDSALFCCVRDSENCLWQTGQPFAGLKCVKYQTGSAEYFLRSQDFKLTLSIAAFPDDSGFLRINYRLDSPEARKLTCDFTLCSPAMHMVSKDIPGKTSGVINIGYGDFTPDFSREAIEKSSRSWAEMLAPTRMSVPEKWMQQECLWSIGQLLSFRKYDGLLDEHYMNLGGYGWGEFAGRECSEVAMSLARWYPEYARQNLRWVAKTQHADGRLPRVWDFTRDVNISPKPLLGEGIKRPDTSKQLWASDQEIWFILACMETANLPDFKLLGENIVFFDGTTASMMEHCRRAFYWVRDVIGAGSHGLIRMLHGDWNDYLGMVGLQGRGESCMNSGMACRAFEKLAAEAFLRGDNVLGHDASEFTSQLKTAMKDCFVGTHFLRGYDDAGFPIGGRELVFLNAQSWAVLGQCGSREQRRAALKTALERCNDDIGLCLMSNAFDVPAPRNVTHCDYPPGQGENAGIWPQTVYWFIWALCEEGLRSDAMKVWKKMSLRNHSRLFPDVPYGIFNGPDCYCSHHAGELHGSTQIELIDRRGTVPMNPIVAWQSWAMEKIVQSH